MPSDTDRITDLVLRRTSATEGAVKDDVQRLKQYGIDDESILKALTMKYGESVEPSLLDVPAVTLIQAGLLISHGIEDPRSLAAANPDDVADTDIGSKSFAKAIIEAAAIVFDESPTLDSLREKTDADDQRIVTTLRPLIAVGIPPSQAADEVAEILNQEPSVLEVCDLNPQAVYHLREEGYETIEDIADASIDELAEVQHVGEVSAERAVSAARSESNRSPSEDESQQSDSDREETLKEQSSREEDNDDSNTSTSAQTRSSAGAQMNDSTDTKESEGGSEPFELRLLLVGSARPNLEDGEVAGIRIRAALESEGYDLSSFDAAIYSGFVSPSPHHEYLDPQSCFEELHDQLQALASQLPVYYITGDYGHGDPLKTVYDADSYAQVAATDPFATAESNLLTYIPTQGTAPLKEIHLTQNPAIASAQENCVLITPDIYPELWNDHDSLAYLAGGQLPGRLIEDSIAPMFSMENVGPKRPDAVGGVHAITLTENGIDSHDLVPLGDSGLISCPDHIDRGLQFAHTESRCIFCYNEDRYFEEWLRSGARKVRHTGRDFDLEEAVEFVIDEANFNPDQVENFREFVSHRIVEDYFGQSEDGPAIDSHRSVNSPLLPDPRDVYDEAALVASDLLRIQSHDRAAYFRRYEVPDTNVTLSREFEEVAPPIPDEMTEGHVELDEAAFNREELGGEWLLFPKRQMIGTVWERVLELVADGRLFDAQVGTAWHHEARSSRSKRYYMGIAVPNYFDVHDIYRVGDLITSEDIVGDDQVFFFKPLLYTRLGIHQRNAESYGIDSSTRYTFSALKNLTMD